MTVLQKEKIKKIYNSFLRKYDIFHNDNLWGLWCQENKTSRDKEEIALGAILAQATNWKNAEMALKNFKKENRSLIKGVYQTGKKDIEKLEKFVKPSGFYKQKAKRIFLFCKFIVENYGSLNKFFRQETNQCRKQLLEISGIGPETADSILLYAGNKLIFVIDEYTRRLVGKHKIVSTVPNINNKLFYNALQELFQGSLPKDIKVYQNFHALIVLDGKKIRQKNGKAIVK